MERGFRSGHIVVTREISYRAPLEEALTLGIRNIEAEALAERLAGMDNFATGPDHRKSP